MASERRSFLDLPTELRLQIYSYIILPSMTAIIYGNLGEMSPPFTPNLKFLAVCKTVYSEMAPMLFESKIFRLVFPRTSLTAPGWRRPRTMSVEAACEDIIWGDPRPGILRMKGTNRGVLRRDALQKMKHLEVKVPCHFMQGPDHVSEEGGLLLDLLTMIGGDDSGLAEAASVEADVVQTGTLSIIIDERCRQSAAAAHFEWSRCCHYNTRSRWVVEDLLNRVALRRELVVHVQQGSGNFEVETPTKYILKMFKLAKGDD